MATKKTPISIDSLLAAQKAEKEAQSKPKFLTKAQREALAGEQKKEEEKLKLAKAEEAKKQREQLERKVYEERFGPGGNAGRDGPSGQYRHQQQHQQGYRGGPPPPQGPRGGHQQHQQSQQLNYGSNVPTGPKATRGRDDSRAPPTGPASHRRDDQQRRPPEPGPSSFRAPPPPNTAGRQPESNGAPPQDDHIPIYDPAALKARYLGDKTSQKRKVRKQSDKKFIFDWDKTEDTATADEVDPLYIALRAGGGHQKGLGAVRMNGNGIVKKEEDGMEDDEPLAGPKITIKAKAKPIIDERHWSEKPLEEMKDRDWRIFREDFSIASRGGNIPLPLRYWSESTIPENIQSIISEVGYAEPSAIQRQAIPIGLNVRDMIGIAETGSGKTAAFVIPMLTYISKLPPLSDANRHMGPYALIMAPTRELAQQIESETRKFTSSLGYKCVSIVGGRSIDEQALNLRDGAEIVIATPGRLKDCIEKSVVVFSQCTYVVMDEADRMISLGFEDVINFILDTLPVSNLKPDTDEAEDAGKMLAALIGGESGQPLADVYAYRQTMMFSATMPPACERLARKYLRRPAIVTIGVAGQAVDSVEQRVEFIAGDDKRKTRLIEILRTEGFEPPIIVFVNTKKAADVLAKDVNRSGWSSTTLHSGKNQEQREAALKSLRDGETNVLVATDLAGRGIDVPDVSLVVNFQMSSTIEAYVHRIGRTGRAGKTGVAVTFLDPGDGDAEVLFQLKEELSKSPISRVPSELSRHEHAQTKGSFALKRKADDRD